MSFSNNYNDDHIHKRDSRQQQRDGLGKNTKDKNKHPKRTFWREKRNFWKVGATRGEHLSYDKEVAHMQQVKGFI